MDLPLSCALFNVNIEHKLGGKMSENLEELDQHVKTCIAIFISLMGLTLITVAVSYLPVPTAATISIALCIALVKGSLVVSYFMHFISEKKLVYWSLTLTATFFFFLMILPVATNMDKIKQLIRLSY